MNQQKAVLTASRHIGMLYGKAERCRTSSWMTLHKFSIGTATKQEVLSELSEACDVWRRILEAAEQMLPGKVDPSPLPQPNKVTEAEHDVDDDPDVDW
jgi:hypothetical protein